MWLADVMAHVVCVRAWLCCGFVFVVFYLLFVLFFCSVFRFFFCCIFHVKLLLHCVCVLCEGIHVVCVRLCPAHGS